MSRARRNCLSFIAGIIFMAATAWLLWDVARSGLSEVVPRTMHHGDGAAVAAELQPFNDLDAIIATWLVSRNAYTLLAAPSRLFEAEQCAPETRTLAYGEPMLSLGVLAVPGVLATGDPIAAYNLAIFALFVVGALAIYAVTLDWTGSWAAAVGSAVLYAFNAERVANLAHPFIYDTTWILLAVYFARRWLLTAKWRYAVALAAAGVMQMGTSLYPIVASALLAAPIGVSLLREGTIRHPRVLQAVMIAIIATSAAYFLFEPYVALRETTQSVRRTEHLFAAWSWLSPHGKAGFTWSALALAIVGLAAHKTPSGRRIPRWSVAVGALLTGAASTGPSQPQLWLRAWGGEPPFDLPNLYAALAAVLPGLDAVRVPARITVGWITATSLLAGIGMSCLLSSAGRFRTALAAAILGLLAFETWGLIEPIRPAMTRSSLLRVAPNPSDLRFFSTLRDMGNAGPLLELPMGDRDREFVLRSPRHVLLSVYHRRRTSACYASYLPPGRDALREVTLRLPSLDAVDEICALGFTTAVVHLDTETGRIMAQQFQAAIPSSGRRLRDLARGDNMAAFELCGAGDFRS